LGIAIIQEGGNPDLNQAGFNGMIEGFGTLRNVNCLIVVIQPEWMVTDQGDGLKVVMNG
jgi:hypothetical protein